MKSTLYLAALLVLSLAAATSSAVAQDKGTKESIAGKAATAPAAKATKPVKPAVQPAAAALKSNTSPTVSKPAGSESSLGLGKDETKSHCHSRGSDA